jgi:hypothetical protein
MAATVSRSAYADFGDILEIKGNSPFPPGWVVIGVRGGTAGFLSAGPAPKPSMASLTFTIMDVTGAAKGQELDVRGNSPIPVGWVILDTKWPTALSVGKYSCPDWEAVHTIKCLVEPGSMMNR